ncbi:protein CASC3-like [Uloborus diversus]|uniref:protein CASC3-like n=1 Tax=Uloborus diversus TaxID=327109 RepID=UPI0024092462|nr:protein CASC3-like [Uloborus diversus]
MADRHRRRRVKSDDDSEGSYSESDIEAEDANDAENSLKGTPEKDGVPKADNSEYESAEEEEDKATDQTLEESRSKDQESLSEVVDEEGGEEGIAETDDVDGDFLNGDNPGDVSDDGEYVEEERQQGDGEECSPASPIVEKELDFDEDRRNPQYIPKKGIFYEHDDRNNEDLKEKEEEPTRDRKKKLWLDEGKWGHDRFREEEQFPKSRHELIETYGYDIRNEDGPPRARRRRRYGRGPTKYERNWEDVSAYGRERFKAAPRGFPRGRRARGRFRGAPRFRGRGRRSFSDRDSDKNEAELNGNIDEVPDNEDVPCPDEKIAESPIINSTDFPALPSKIESEPVPEPEKKTYYPKEPVDVEEPKSVRTLTFENSNLSGRNSIEREVPPRRGKASPFNNSYDRGNRKPARGNRGSGRGEYPRRGRGGMRHISPRFLEHKMNNLNSEMEQLNVNDTQEVCNGVPSEVHQSESVNNLETEMPNMALKGAGDSSGRPKRYSSLRQRSLPETNTYQTNQQTVPPPHSSYYEGYQPTMYAAPETGVPTPSTQSQPTTTPPIMNPSAYQTFAPTPYPDSFGLRLPVTTAPPPQLFPQATVPAGQPILAPPPCITPTPNIMNFAPPPPPTGYHQFTYQQYATPPPPPAPAPPSDIYQPGITYYYPQNQPPSVRPTVQKRPKAAIPILPPPEREHKQSAKKDSNHTSNGNKRNFQENSDSINEVSSLRTDSSPQLQTSVGVES